MNRLAGRSLALVGLALVGGFVVLALAAPLVAPFDPVSQPARRLLPPGGRHLLGTDEFGRDVLSRIVHGARVSLEVGCVSVSLALALGGTLGLLSGYYVGLVDRLTGRLVDVVFAFPSVLLVIAIAGVVGPSLATAMLAIGIVYSPIFARVVRGPTLAVTQAQFVEGARALGAGRGRLIGRHLLPNVLPPLLVYTSTLVGMMIVASAGLSFLGLGVQPPTPDWGVMVGNGRLVLYRAAHVATVPGIVIVVVALAFNFVGDGLREALDPRARR
jgi:peptide/nickel transport system permease protein